jgi:HlyD family secretion protein
VRAQTYDDGVNRSLRALGVASILLITASACSGKDDAAVRLGTVGRSTVTEAVEAPATVTAKATAEVTAVAGGRVAQLTVREGQSVRAGRVLVRIDSPDAFRALREARRADAEAASAGTVSLPGSGLTSRQVQADRAALKAFTQARTTAQQIPDPQLRSQALAAVQASQAQYAAAAAQAQDAIRRFDAGIGNLAQALGSLASAQRVQTRAAVVVAERTVEGLTVRAPIDGVVSLTRGTRSGAAQSAQSLLGQLPQSLQDQAGQALGQGGAPSAGSVSGSLAVGQPVTGGQTLVTITDVSSLTLTAQVDETDVLLVRPGVAATAELDAVPGASYEATVATIDPSPTTSSRGGVAYVVRLALARGTTQAGTTAPDPRPGMSAVVDLQVRTARDVVAVPASAVFRDGKRDAVWVQEAGQARKRHVQLGAQGASEVQVLEGLKTGERIVVRGADRVHDGQQVR